MKTIVIIGGGFGGVYAAKHILAQSQKNVEVILMSEHNYFLFTPMLHEVATGGISRDNIIQPIHGILNHGNFRFLKGKVNNVDTKKKVVIAKEFTQPYDALVLATGSSINFFGIPGAEEHSIPLRSLHDSYRIRNKVIEQIERAEETDDVKKRKQLLTFMVVGGGPTGVELAGELAEFVKTMLCSHYKRVRKEDIRIMLIHRGDHLLKQLPAYFGKKCAQRLEKLGIELCFGCAVEQVGKGYIVDQHKKKTPAATIFWTAGFKANTVPLNNKPIKRYEVNAYLKVANTKHIFAIGDCALLLVNGKPVPMLAQVATKQGTTAAHNALATLTHKPLKAYEHKLDGFLISVGQYFGAAEIGKMHFSGFFAWWLWRTIYLGKLLGIGNKIRVAVDWTLNFFYPRDTSEVHMCPEQKKK